MIRHLALILCVLGTLGLAACSNEKAEQQRAEADAMSAAEEARALASGTETQIAAAQESARASTTRPATQPAATSMGIVVQEVLEMDPGAVQSDQLGMLEEFAGKDPEGPLADDASAFLATVRGDIDKDYEQSILWRQRLLDRQQPVELDESVKQQKWFREAEREAGELFGKDKSAEEGFQALNLFKLANESRFLALTTQGNTRAKHSERAARLFRRVMSEYPESRAAEMARTYLGEMAEKGLPVSEK